MSKGSEGRRPICSRELGAEICGAELFFFPMPRQNLCLPHPGPRRRDPWRRDVIPRRHDAWRRPPESISAFEFSRGPIVNFFQKKSQIVKKKAWPRLHFRLMLQQPEKQIVLMASATGCGVVCGSCKAQRGWS